MKTTPAGGARRWLWIPAVWSSIALFEATQTVFGMRAEGMHHNWGALFVTILVSWLPWALVTPVPLYLGRQRPLKLIVLLMHAGVAIAINTVSSAWFAWIVILLNPYATAPPPGPFLHVWFSTFYSGLLSALMVYAAIVTLGQILESRTRLALEQTERARLNEQLSRAQLSALRRQIEPHFLFNSLNSITGLIRDKQNDAAVTMIARLGDLLRRVIENSSRQLVPLAEEMEFTERYLEIQKVRFAERLQLNIDVPDDLLSAQVPSLLLQPMIENAVKHGISKRARGGAIRISACRINSTLMLRVYNDGPALQAGADAMSGVGIANVRTRLRTLYGDACRLSIHNQDPDGVEVAVSLPYRES
jgi:two-component system LytT family sensor kinase